MRHIIILLVLLGAGGCTLFERDVSPEQRWAAAGTLYASTLQSLTQLKAAGVLDDEDKARIEPYRIAARAAIDAMETSIVTGGGNFEQAWRAFSSAIDALLLEQAKAQGGAE